jgi:probable phosphoglycerate mutase
MPDDTAADRSPRLVLVRHGETAWSRDRRHTGRTDVPLTPLGRLQAKALRDRLRGHEFSLVLTSPLERALATCRLAGFGEQAECTDDLEEWDYGAYDGLTTDDIREQRPGWSLWRDGVPGGESLATVAERAEQVIAVARGVSGDVLAFAHAHVLRVLAVRWLELPAGDAAHLVLGPASISVLGWEREAPAILSWNDGGQVP